MAASVLSQTHFHDEAAAYRGWRRLCGLPRPALPPLRCDRPDHPGEGQPHGLAPLWRLKAA